jgi:hypothetical protein
LNPNLRFLIEGVNASREAFAETRADLAKVESQTTRLARVGGTARAVFAGFAGGIAAMATTEALFEIPKAIQEIVESVAQLPEISDKLGIPVERLQELQYGAERANVSFEDLEAGLTRFNLELAKNGDLAQTFRDNGVTMSRDAYSNLLKYADLIKNARNEQERLLLVQQAFGKGSSDLVNFFSGGAAAVEEFARQRQALGPLVTSEEAERIHKIKDDWDDLARKASYGIKGAIVFTVEATAQSDFVKTLFNLLQNPTSGRAWLDSLSPALGSWLAPTGSEHAQGLRDQMSNLQMQLDNTVQPNVRAMLQAQIDDIKAQLGAAPPGWAASARASENASMSALSLLGHGDGTTKTHSGTGSDKDPERKIRAVWEALEKQWSALNSTNEEQAVYNNLAAAGVDANSAMGIAIANQTRLLFEQEEQLKRNADRAQFFGDTIYDALDGMMFHGEKAIDVLRNLIVSLGEAALKAALLNVGPFASGQGAAQQKGGLGGLIGSLLNSVLGFATGGSFEVGGSGAPDSQLVPLRLTPGEIVNISRNPNNADSGGPTLINVSVDGARGNAEIRQMAMEGTVAALEAHDRTQARRQKLAG